MPVIRFNCLILNVFFFVQRWCVYLPRGIWDSSVVFAWSFFEKPLGQQLNGGGIKIRNIISGTCDFIYRPGMFCSFYWACLPISLNVPSCFKVTPASRRKTPKTLSFVSSGAGSFGWRPVLRLFLASIETREYICYEAGSCILDFSQTIVKYAGVLMSVRN